MDITIKNARTGKSLSLTKEQGITLIKVTGLEPVKASLTTQQNIGTNGVSIINVCTAGRSITLNLALEGTSPQTARRKIYEVATPTEKVILLIYTEGRAYKATGYVEAVQVDTWSTLQPVQIDVLCSSPYLESVNSTLKIGTNAQPKFKFPFHTDKNSEDILYFGEKQDVVQTVIQYDGEIPTGAIFSIIASEPMTNPVITNLVSGHSLGITGSLAKDEELRICTETGSKSIKIVNRLTGAERNALKMKASAFDWLKIEQGENILILSATQGAQTAVFTVEYSEKFVGV